MVCSVVLAVLFGSSAFAGENIIQKSRNAVPGQYIVTVADSVAADRIEAVADRAATLGATVRHVYTNAIKGFAITAPEAVAGAIGAFPDVVRIEEDAVGRIDATQTGATYNLDRLDTRSRVYDGNYNYNYTGSVASIYIVDTGVRSMHSEYWNRFLGGYSAINDNNWVNDCHGHGTHVAGIAAGATYGVAKGAGVLSVRVCDCAGNCTISDVVAGLNYIIQNQVVGASNVANMSLSFSANTTLDTAVNNVIDAGVTVVAGAGNSGLNACNFSPSRVPRVITVGASDVNDSRWVTSTHSSNTGSCVDIWAPGSNVTSSWHTSDTATNTISGTSMASPHVAGMAAQYLDTNWGALPTTVSNALINNATTGVLSNIGTSPNRLLHIVP